MDQFELAQPIVCILMATYNGEKYLAEQLQSIENQSYKNWRVVMSDDGSKDDTIAIAKLFQKKWGNDRLEVRIRKNSRKGFCQNFLSMACDSSICADLYAFSDQDDVWLTDKLERAVSYFNQHKNSPLPRAYGSRTQIVDETLKPLGFSSLFALPRSFRNALVQSICGGNTQVFNQTTKKILEEAGQLSVVSHDWWLYQVVQGAGGTFFYDPQPSLLYRQHPNAIVGANLSLKANFDRVIYVLDGRFKIWNDINCNALNKIRHLLNKDSQDILDIFYTFRNAKLKDRIRMLEVCGVYRQTWRGSLSLWIATLINRV